MMSAKDFVRTTSGRLLATMLGLGLLGAGIAAIAGPGGTAEPTQPHNPGLWIMSLTCMVCVAVGIFSLGFATRQSGKHFIMSILSIPIVAGVFICYYREISEAGQTFGGVSAGIGVAWLVIAGTRTPIEIAHDQENPPEPSAEAADHHH
jgi:hypothetical protein